MAGRAFQVKSIPGQQYTFAITVDKKTTAYVVYKFPTDAEPVQTRFIPFSESELISASDSAIRHRTSRLTKEFLPLLIERFLKVLKEDVKNNHKDLNISYDDDVELTDEFIMSLTTDKIKGATGTSEFEVIPGKAPKDF